MLESIKRGLKGILRNKLRFILTVSGIAVGIMAVVIISIIGEIGKTTVNSELMKMGLDSIVVSAANNSSVGLSEDTVTEIESVDGIKKAIPLMSIVTKSTLLKDTKNCMLWGIDENAPGVIDLKVLHGRLINKGDVNSSAEVCLIDEDLALSAYKRSNVVGKKISVDVNGVKHEYQIVGVVKSGVNMLQSMLGDIIPAFVYTPYTVFSQQTGKENFDSIAVKLYDENSNISGKIENTIEIKNDGMSINVQNLLGQKDTLSGILDTVTIVLTFIAGISLVVSGLSIMTVMMTAVSERTREIGIKKAIGADKKAIITEFLIESALITLSGCIAGILIGVLLGAVGCLILGYSFMISAKLIVLLISVSVISGLIFGGYPAYKAASLKPVDALRK